ncbi:MAG: hypothetical protein ACJATA_001705 [Sphingobacteriales bacterium]|jgi:hypothetical protein
MKKALGNNISKLFRIKEHPGFTDNFMELLSFFTHAKGKDIELTRRRESGIFIPLGVSFTPWERESKFFYSWIFRDVSTRNETQNKLKMVCHLGIEIVNSVSIESAFENILEKHFSSGLVRRYFERLESKNRRSCEHQNGSVY